MTTTMVLVRHGEHDLLGRELCGRKPGVGLSEAGRSRAAAVAARLAQASVAAVYSSRLERAWETGEAVARACGAPLEADDDLLEVDFGDWTGAAFDDLAADPRWTRWNADRGRSRAPGGETLHEAQGRIARWLSTVAERHPDAVVVGVSHSDVIKAGLAHALGLPLHFYDRFEISPASTSVVMAGDWGMKVHSINEAAS